MLRLSELMPIGSVWQSTARAHYGVPEVGEQMLWKVRRIENDTVFLSCGKKRKQVRLYPTKFPHPYGGLVFKTRKGLISFHDPAVTPEMSLYRNKKC